MVLKIFESKCDLSFLCEKHFLHGPRYSFVNGFGSACESKCVAKMWHKHYLHKGWDCGTCPRQIFVNRAELLEAVDDWLLDPSPTSAASVKYGYPIGNWNVELVSDFSNVFDATRNRLAEVFNDDISGWQVGAATNMRAMFKGARNFDQDINKWDVSTVTDMNELFADATSFNSPLWLWQTSNVRDMTATFSGAFSFNRGIGEWDVSRVVSMAQTFADAITFSRDISTWNTRNVENMMGIFNRAITFNRDIAQWNTEKVDMFLYAFEDATSFNQDISRWNVSSALLAQEMFSGANSFNQNLCAWGKELPETTIVTDMFLNSGCSSRAEDPDVTRAVKGPLCDVCLA